MSDKTCEACGMYIERGGYHDYGCPFGKEKIATLTAEVAALQKQLAQQSEDAEVGKAIREYFAGLSGWGVIAKLEISLYRYDIERRPEPHWWVYGDFDGILTNNEGDEVADCTTLTEALQAANLLDTTKQVTE